MKQIFSNKERGVRTRLFGRRSNFIRGNNCVLFFGDCTRLTSGEKILNLSSTRDKRVFSTFLEVTR